MKKKNKNDYHNQNQKVERCRQCGLELSQEDIRKGYKFCEFCRQDYGKDYSQKFAKKYREEWEDEEDYGDFR